MRIPHSIGHYEGRSNAINSGRLENMFMEPTPVGEKTPSALISCPGIKVWADTETGRQVRGMFRSSETPEMLYVAAGNNIYSYDTDKTKTRLRRLYRSRGRVSMAENANELAIVDGKYGYTLDFKSRDCKRIHSAGFPETDQIVAQDGYFIASRKGTGETYVSNLHDGRTWVAYNYATSEGAPDDTVAQVSDHRELWLFGDRTVEVRINTGRYSFPFERLNNAYIEKGCAAANSVVKLDNSILWLSHEKQIVRADGYTPKAVSTPQLDYQIAHYVDVSDAYAFGYVFEGKPWYQITFPNDGATWVLDMSTWNWHKRSSWSDSHRDQEWQHRAYCYALFDNKHLVGDYRNGLIYEINSDNYADHNKRMKKVFTIMPIHTERRKITHDYLELEFEYGVGAFGDYMADVNGKYVLDAKYNFVDVLDPETGNFPNIYATLEYTEDGTSWEGKRSINIGRAGKYKHKTVVEGLGTAESRVYRVTVTDPVKVVLVAAYIEGEAA